MAVPFVDYTTISDILTRLSTIESQIGLYNSSTSSTSASGLFFVASALTGTLPTTESDLSKIRVVAFEGPKVTLLGQSDPYESASVSVGPFAGASAAFFSVTPRIVTSPSVKVLNGDVSAKYIWDSSSNKITYYISRSTSGADAASMDPIVVRPSIIGIAIFP